MKAVDFVDKLLRYDHQERPTAKEAMVTAQSFSIFITALGLDLCLVFILGPSGFLSGIWL